MKLWNKIFSYRRYFIYADICAGLMAVIIPVGLVIYHRWLMHPNFDAIIGFWWYTIPFLKHLSLPTYFIVIFPMFVFSIYIFSMLALLNREKLPDIITEIPASEMPHINLPKSQSHISMGLFIFAGLGFIVDMLTSLIRQTIPGIEVLVIALLLLSGWYLKEYPLTHIRQILVKNAGWVVAYCNVLAAALVLLQYFFGEESHQPGAVVILIAIIGVIMHRWYRKIPVILWVSLGALLLYAWGMDSWLYTVIGDEHGFFNIASYISMKPISEIGKEFFSVSGVFGTHTFLVSLFQSVFLKIFGNSNFGWRISNPVILSAAVVCFYLFFRKFTTNKTALIISGLLACSSYLMNFGKIGYDNPQAFFMLSLILWLAAEAVLSHRTLVYALLGSAMGFGLYSYPAVLYALPLPILLMALFDLPKSKPAFIRWVSAVAMTCIIAMPLVFQPLYGSSKLEGLFIHYPDNTALHGIGFYFAAEMIYSLFAYLYMIEESHFITVAHVDPFSAMWIPIGLGWLVAHLRKHKFALFWIISFVLMLFLAGASHGRMFPPNTRMIMLLPWWVSFASFGISWVVNWISHQSKSPRLHTGLMSAMMAIVVVSNLTQVHLVFPQRYAGGHSFETVFLRLSMRMDNDPGKHNPTYLFITDEHWGIDGMHLLQNLYHSPRSRSQLKRIIMTGNPLDQEQLNEIQAANTIVILQPWMNAEWQASFGPVMSEAGKNRCDVRETADTTVKFTAYFPVNLDYLCPVDGNWHDE
ncbi:MAG: glycosyltransferase family 39 protein [Anaerolineaceae bacterium]|nr:glycosyltransferase family 39 protein [Anaerolineaceae bacterium]